MSSITLVQPQKNNRHKFNIFLDGKFAFATDEDTLVNLRLIKGRQLTAADLEKILLETKVGSWMESMYRLFALRQRSEKEVRDYFKLKQLQSKVKGKELISDVLIAKVIDRLKQKGLIDDLEFARSWAEARSRKKGFFAILTELYQKGISKDIIEQLSDINQSAQAENTAEVILTKKLKSWVALPYLKKKKKAYEFLMRRGFEYEVIKEVIEKLIIKG